MALVMLPCELPWWSSLQRHLKHLLLASSTQKLVDGMFKIHEMCNISVDPDEDEKDPDLMKGFAEFLDNDLTENERSHFMDQTLPTIIHRALQLKQWKPAAGLVFSLQQQPDLSELSYDFISSLLAHAFFSTYPKRTMKTHPTLQDFNFSYFFKHLDRPCQKSKLKSIFHYFDWLEKNNNEGCIKISRQTMSSKQWLTIEDWLECSLPLSRIQIKHEGRIERGPADGMEVCFVTARLGGQVLAGSQSQESIVMCTVPEVLALMLCVEALEDNEMIRVEGARRFARISDTKGKARLELLDAPVPVSLCLMDPEDYSSLPLGQYEEDNVLRELNKCLLGFQQKPMKPPEVHARNTERRLSPIGESFSHTPPSVEASIMIKQTSASTVNSRSRSTSPENFCAATINLKDPSLQLSKNKCFLSPEMNTLNNRRGRFIVLGSSGECLPVKRPPPIELCDSLYSSCTSSFDEFHSANTSLDDSEDEEQQALQYSNLLNTAERRESFAQRLRDALRREMDSSFADSMSTDLSFDVGISVPGSQLNDNDIRLKRDGSCGFVLVEDQVEDEEFLSESLQQEQQWICKFRSRQSPGLTRRDTNDSSKYSFSTEYSSEMEEVYEQFHQWLNDPIVDRDPSQARRDLDPRDMAVVRFASALLKRTLSESFAGVPLTDGYPHVQGENNINTGNIASSKTIDKKRLAMNVRSLSLELARHKHKLASQLLAQLANKKSPSGSCLRPVVTGNWGCGSTRRADPQLKLVVQWLAASVAGTPHMVYYTAGNQLLFKLDTLYRVLVDRKWTVGQLANAALRFAHQTLHEHSAIPDNNTLFDELIGIDKYNGH